MNEMATVEYLLRQYEEYMSQMNFAINNDNYTSASYYNGKVDLIRTIIHDRFGMTIRETDTEYIAENGVCSVRVNKEKAK